MGLKGPGEPTIYFFAFYKLHSLIDTEGLDTKTMASTGLWFVACLIRKTENVLQNLLKPGRPYLSMALRFSITRNSQLLYYMATIHGLESVIVGPTSGCLLL